MLALVLVLVAGEMMYRKEPRQAASLLPIMSEAISLHYRLRNAHNGPLCAPLADPELLAYL